MSEINGDLFLKICNFYGLRLIADIVVLFDLVFYVRVHSKVPILIVYLPISITDLNPKGSVFILTKSQ